MEGVALFANEHKGMPLLWKNSDLEMGHMEGQGKTQLMLISMYNSESINH